MIATGALVPAGGFSAALAKAEAMAAAFDAMIASAFAFDGSYELARDHFNALSGKGVNQAE